MPLNDMAKCEAIKTMLGFNVTKAIEIERLAKEDDAVDNTESAGAASGKRRSAASTINNITNKSTTSGYKVVSRGE